VPIANPDRVLGFLASTFVITHHEVAATTSVAYLVGRSPGLEQALRSLISTRSGVALDAPLSWKAEPILPSGARPDLEGSLGDVPRVRVEAKFGAVLTAEQVHAYRWDPSTAGALPSAVAVIVPAARHVEAARVIATARTLPSPDLELPEPWTGIITWDELVDGMTAGANPHDREDLDQLRSLITVAEGLEVPPFTNDESWSAIAERYPDLVTVVDQATRPGVAAGPFPSSPDRQHTWRRYSELKPTTTNLSVGIRRDWLQLDTANFSDVVARAGSTARPWTTVDGHLFLPLTLPREVTGSVAARHLAQQVVAVCTELGLPTNALPGFHDPDLE
jgi:hypothetical protein